MVKTCRLLSEQLLEGLADETMLASLAASQEAVARQAAAQLEILAAQQAGLKAAASELRAAGGSTAEAHAAALAAAKAAVLAGIAAARQQLEAVSCAFGGAAAALESETTDWAASNLATVRRRRCFGARKPAFP